jgi:hypothetical protein
MYGLIRAERFAQSFTAGDWQVLGRAGDFLLISDAPWRIAHTGSSLQEMTAGVAQSGR